MGDQFIVVATHFREYLVIRKYFQKHVSWKEFRGGT